MSKKADGKGNDYEREGRNSRPLRADAQRNTDALLEASLAVFATSGVDAPVREIAVKAGVVIGTVYRHFPQRSDLIVAVFRQQVDAQSLEPTHPLLRSPIPRSDRSLLKCQPVEGCCIDPVDCGPAVKPDADIS